MPQSWIEATSLEFRVYGGKGGGGGGRGSSTSSFEAYTGGGEKPGDPPSKGRSNVGHKPGDVINIPGGGNLDIIQFRGLDNGLQIGLGYNGPNADYRLLQTIGTNVGIDGRKSPYIDGTPYYNYDPYGIKLPGNYKITFQDTPGRPRGDHFIVWKAELSLVKNTSSGNQRLITLKYGFMLAPEKWGGNIYIPFTNY